ncbi:MAG: hypothetical protein M1371_03425 [Actinobacteria bacterium]|nr:hypothetical protein [Actinomycetota bacterium]
MVEEKELNEKKHNGDGKDPLGILFAALIIMLVGILFLLRSLGYIQWNDWWKYLLIGLGSIFLIDAIIRSSVPQYRRSVLDRVIPGIILIAVGFGFLLGFGKFWPVILIVVGVGLIITFLVRLSRPRQ